MAAKPTPSTPLTATAPLLDVAASKKIALVGAPNTGKSTLFNALTGLRQRTGNFPGVTVERRAGRVKLPNDSQVELIDLPGTYGLYPRSEDERITCSILRTPQEPDYPDLVLVIADASQPRPGLLIATQVHDLGLPVIVVLNRGDVKLEAAQEQYLSRLPAALGLPVVRISALTGEGLDELRAMMQEPPPPLAQAFFTIPGGLLGPVHQLKETYSLASDYAAYQHLLKPLGQLGQAEILNQGANIEKADELIANEILVRYDRLDALIERSNRPPGTSRKQGGTPSATIKLTNRLDSVLLHRVWGYVVLIGILLLVFQSIFTWAEAPMNWIDQGMGALGEGVRTLLPAGWATALLVDGIIAGLQGIVVFVPQIALLFLFIALMEGTGYMARVVFLMDRLMRPLGLSGRSVVPLFGGFACAVPSIMAARTIPNAKERLMTILITPLMSCSARIPVYTVLIAVFVPSERVWGIFDMRGLVMGAFYALGIVVGIVVALVLKRLLGTREGNLFITELPAYHPPRWRNIFIDIGRKVRAFLVEAGKVILIISVVLWFLASYGPSEAMDAARAQHAQQLAGGLEGPSLSQLELEASFAGHIGLAIEPAIRPLGYDWKMGIALISSFAAREVFVGTMSTLYSIGDDDEGFSSLTERLKRERSPETGKPSYSIPTVLSLLVFYSLAMQCMSTFAIIKRELNSWFWAGLQLVYQSAIAYFLALLTYQFLAA